MSYRILISAFVCSPVRGSEPSCGWNWAKVNAEFGNDVVCLTSDRWRDEIDRELAERPVANLRFEYVNLPQLGLLGRVPKVGALIDLYATYILWQRRAGRRAADLHAGEPFDLAHHVTWASAQQGSGLARLGVPLVFGPVGGGQFPAPSTRPYFEATWQTERLRQLMSSLLLRVNPDSRRTMRSAAIVLAANAETAQLARRAGAHSVELVLDSGLPEHFAPEHSPPVPSAPPLKLLWVGRLFERKGLDLVLDAVSKLPAELDWRLTVLGDGPLGERLPGRLDALGISDRVDWRGNVPWREVANAYESHHLFVFCTLRDSFGSQLLEAMAFGLPVVCLRQSGAGDFVPEQAGVKVAVVSEDLPQAIADSILALHDDHERYEVARSVGREFAATQTWPLKVARIQNTYRRVVDSSAARTSISKNAMDAPFFVVGGVRIDAMSMTEAVSAVLCGAGPMSVHLCNAYTIALADSDASYREVLNEGSLNLPDGRPVAWVGRRLGHDHLVGPVPGPDLFARALTDGVPKQTRHYLFGSTPETLAQLLNAISVSYPGALVAGSEAPPFGDLTDDQLTASIEQMVAVDADVVWVGLGTPRQDVVVERLRKLGPHKYVAVGAAFDFLAGTSRRAPEPVRRLGLEWLFRLVSEPKRLWRRYLFGNVRFLVAAVKSLQANSR